MTGPPRYASVPAGEPRLLEGARLFNAGRYFESHDVWESLWHDVSGDDREMLQALIQFAAACHHAAQGNPVGARYLFERATVHAARWLPRYADVALEDLAADVERWLHPPATPPICRISHLS